MGKLKYLTEVKTKDIFRDYDSFHKDKQQRKDFFFLVLSTSDYFLSYNPSQTWPSLMIVIHQK